MINRIYGYTKTTQNNKNIYQNKPQVNFGNISLISPNEMGVETTKVLRDLNNIENVLKIVTNLRANLQFNEKASGAITAQNGKPVYRGVFSLKPPTNSEEKFVNNRLIAAFFSPTEEGNPSHLSRLDYVFKADKTTTFRITRDNVLEPIFKKWEEVFGAQGKLENKKPQVDLLDEVELVLRHEMQSPSSERFSLDLGEDGHISFEPKGNIKNKFPHIQYEPRIKGSICLEKPQIITPEDSEYSKKIGIAAKALTSKLLSMALKNKIKVQNLSLTRIKETILNPLFNFN